MTAASGDDEPEFVRDWRAFLSRVEIKGPIPIVFCIGRDTTGLWVLQSWMEVAHRDDHQQIWIALCNKLPDATVDKALVIRQRVLGHYQHEALEHIHIDGVRAFDPHAERWGSQLVSDWRFNV